MAFTSKGAVSSHERRLEPLAESGSPSWRTTIKVLVALGGRSGWRYWIATAAWLVTGLITVVGLRIARPHDDSGASMLATLPSGLYLFFYLIVVGLLWGWGARQALTLGLARGMVYVTTWTVSLMLGLWIWFSAQVANHVEMLIVGRNGWRAFAIETSNKMGTDDSIFNASVTLMLMYGLPVLVVLICVLAGFIGRGVVGVLFGALAGIATIAFAVVALSAVPASLGVSAQWLTYLAPPLIAGVCGAVGWWLFRAAPKTSHKSTFI